jgi:DNA/RNA endonuclease G (NUC1)
MTPNEAINRQFGRLAQMETFFMTNMSPQRGPLNTGVWLKLEKAILNIEDTPRQKDHVWALVGPIFSANPETLEHSGTQVPIPESYFCITVDPHTYPYNTLSKVDLLCLIIPQDAPRADSPLDYLSSLAQVEEATRLTFFPGWARPRAAPGIETPIGAVHEPEAHRLLRSLRRGDV